MTNANENTSYSMLADNKIRSELALQVVDQEHRIEELEEALHEHGIELPEAKLKPQPASVDAVGVSILEDGSIDELRRHLEQRVHLYNLPDTDIEFHNLNFSTTVDVNRSIYTAGSFLSSLVCWWQLFPPQRKIDILADATGRIPSRRMTLLIGPPGSGKSGKSLEFIPSLAVLSSSDPLSACAIVSMSPVVLLKALAGKLHSSGKAKYSGEVYFEGDSVHSGKFIPSKVADYIEQGDTHEAILSVDETFKFAWECTTGGHHDYGVARDEAAAEILRKDDAAYAMVQNTIAVLGLKGCKDTCVGDAMIRGISGGQKRRVTIGELMVCPRPVKLMDCISNGLDSATAFDIINSVRAFTHTLGLTTVISLLQPPPDVYNLFDDIIVLSEGHIIYHGPRDQVMSYFTNLGYECPELVDEADFLQELPTPEGRKYRMKPSVPHTTSALAAAWKSSEIYKQMLAEMRYPSLDDARALSKGNPKQWSKESREKFAGSLSFYFQQCVRRQFQIIYRNAAFVNSRIGQSVLIGAVTGSLFNNISTKDTTTMNGFLFNAVLFSCLSNISTLPVLYDQRNVYYKQKDALFFPTTAFTFAQMLAFLPLQIIEAILYVSIVYWSADLSAQENGSRFLTNVVISIAFGVCFSQIFRLIAALMPTMNAALPLCGISIVLSVLFSGFIQPKPVISDGWIWFYWINPLAWALKAVTVNEYASSKYDFMTCVNAACTEHERFGDYTLKQYGNPTNERYIWYSFAVLIAEFIFFFVLTDMAMNYVRSIPTPPPPVRIDAEDEERYDVESAEALSTPVKVEQLPFDPLVFSFKNIGYRVTLPNKEEIDLLQDVNGFFTPGSVTALMGSSGAGKTTLLDVLAGRKNTGVVTGEMFINGVPKVDAYFRKVTAYVEQFDMLSTKSTTKESIAFSAALRLSGNVTSEERAKWVNSVIKMMDLDPLADEMIGILGRGGMSFEQRKRVSIGVELASNPSIIFLDEPTTGLDSRAAQILVHNIRTIAATGRSVVCTIHQPSTVIFNSFDSLLLLMRGGRTVFFGELGSQGKNLIDHFQRAPGVQPIPHHMNPATWMLDVIGAGTSVASSSGNHTDFVAHYKNSALCEVNTDQLDTLSRPIAGSRRLTAEDMEEQTGYNASYINQFINIMYRFTLTYWRSPMYTITRPVVNAIIALIFASAYPLYSYHNNIELISLTAVVYTTVFFISILAIIMIVPVAMADRGVYYREQQSRMYHPAIYTFAMFLVDLPTLFLSSVTFTLPFFYIVGLNSPGHATPKFFWFLFFSFMMQGVFLYLGQFFGALTPDEATSQVAVGLCNTATSLFCGFLIVEDKFPDFWIFMYWLNPLHYSLEGLYSSQFKDDHTLIKTSNGAVTDALDYITKVQFTTWKYEHIGYDVLGLCLLVVGAVICNYLALTYLRHDKR